MNRTARIVVALVAVLAAGLLGAIYYVAGTPQYSLYLLRNAARDGDRATFRRHFDLERVIASAIERKIGGVPAGPRIVSQKATERLIPAAEELLRERIDERLDDPGAAALLNMEVDSVRHTETAALVTLRDPADGSTTSLTLVPTSGRHWKVVDVDLTKASVNFTIDEVRQRAEATIPPALPIQRPGMPITEVPLPAR